MKANQFLQIEPNKISETRLHQLLMGAVTPRPIALASTISGKGEVNLAPFSFYNVVSTTPPVLIISVTSRRSDNSNKHTWSNVNEVPEITINSVSEDIVQQMNITSCDYSKAVNEFKKSGLTPIPSDFIAPPRILESMIQMECKVIETMVFSKTAGSGHLIICEMIKMHINKHCLDANSSIDNDRLNLIGRLGKNWYSRTNGTAKFAVSGAAKKLGIGVDALPDFIRNSHVLTGNELGIMGMVEQFPTKLEIEKWYLSNGEKYSGMKDVDFHIEARRLIEGNNAEGALLLLLSSSFSYDKASI